MNLDTLLPIRLHPKASDFLFMHYHLVKKIFRDVLGLIEIDYIGIAFINPKNELFFLSSHPSIEFNLIASDLWSVDTCLQEPFIKQNKPILWDNLYGNNIISNRVL